MAIIKDKFVTVEPLSVVHEYDKNKYISKTNPDCNGRMSFKGDASFSGNLDSNSLTISDNVKLICENGTFKIVFKDTIYYVSLGDSIAAGQAINDDWEKDYGYGSQYGSNGNQSTVIVPNSYTDLIRDELESSYSKKRIVAASFAHSGDTVADLMNKLSDDTVKNALKNADLVTICIGANDVLQPAMSNLEEYINYGDLTNLETIVEGNLAILDTDSNQTSYVSLFNKLTEINPYAKYVFTTIYNPYKYLWLEEGRNGFFAPLLNTIPEMNIDVDKYIEDTFLGGTDLSYYDITKFEWVPIELDLDLDGYIKDNLLSTPIVQTLFSRVNGLGSWAEKYVSKLNRIIKTKINDYQSNNFNFSVAETKALFDTYPDRPYSGDVHYNDLVNVEYTRGYNVATMDWGRLYGGDPASYWTNLAWKYLSFNNAVPSTNVWDYVSFDMNGFAAELVNQIIEKVIVPDVDPHPEEYGQYVMKCSFMDALN